MDEAIKNLYSDQVGGSLPFFAGGTHQWGGSILGTIARFAFPILKRIIGVATNTAEDMIEGRKNTFKEALIDNTMKEVGSVFQKRPAPADNLSMTTKAPPRSRRKKA